MNLEQVVVNKARVDHCRGGFVLGLKTGCFFVRLIVGALALGVTAVQAQEINPTAYVVGTAHLDTQWNWTYVDTIREYLPRTMRDNFALFEKYPHYIFNFSGANRYRMIKEYYPADYARVKEYVAKGRWFPCGSSWEESDVNVPSSESLIRQILYGRQYFKQEFGTESAEYMLPDCFGFPASLPSILNHCGIKGFSTQKLSWGSAVGTPFAIGRWEGPDGQSVIAALKPGPYIGYISTNMSGNAKWMGDCKELGKKTGLYAIYRYYGTGDKGGAPSEDSVKWAEASATSQGPLTFVSAKADQMFRDVTDEQQSKMEVYKGDLLLTQHSSGSISSAAYMKRWNRMNEVLAGAAEKASVAAHLLGSVPYPREHLFKAWGLVLGGQFHDILPGTSVPKAYEYSLNDEVIALNTFAATLTEGVAGVARGLDTRVAGVPLVVFNPLSIDREDPVEATLALADGADVQVYDADGRPVPTQILGRTNGTARILFRARVPSVGMAVFSAVEGKAKAITSGLSVTTRSVENARYRVTLNESGDIASVFDKAAKREMLAAPARWVFTYENPAEYPAWNMDWSDRQQPPRGYVDGPAKIRVVEDGPVRVALEVERQAFNSTFIQTIRLAGGSADDRVEVSCKVAWQTKVRALRAEFPLTVSNPQATYNWELGKIARGNNNERKYEVPTHQWMDLTDTNGTYGVSILTDCKYGSDKPADNVLRLTLLYTPGTRAGYRYEAVQDWGHNEFVYGLVGHTGTWKTAGTDWTAMRLGQPMPVFQTTKHTGTLGKSFSLIQSTSDQVAVQAVKLAENNDAVIVRLQELRGEAVNNVEISACAGIKTAVEVNGVETPLRLVAVSKDKVSLNFAPYQIRSLALTLKAPASMAPVVSTPVVLPYDSDIFSLNGKKGEGAFDAAGRSLPSEMISDTVASGGIAFKIGPRDGAQLNAVVCRGQTIELPKGDGDRVYFLAAATEGDTNGVFTMGSQTVPLTIQSWGGYIGQWDTRRFKGDWKLDRLDCGFIKRDPLAWFCSHRHLKDGKDDIYAYSYLFTYAINRPAGATSLTLPVNDKIRIVAVSVAKDAAQVVVPAHALYDDFTGRQPLSLVPEIMELTRGNKSLGETVLENKPSLNLLSIPPCKNPLILSRQAGVTVRSYGPKARLLSQLNDGVPTQNDDDVKNSVWFDNDADGSPFIMDLKKPMSVTRVRTYSWHKWGIRASQYFAVWGATGESMPDPTFGKETSSRWTLLGVVDTRSSEKGGAYQSTVSASSSAPLGTFRWLLWVNSPYQGTFFTELEVE